MERMFATAKIVSTALSVNIVSVVMTVHFALKGMSFAILKIAKTALIAIFFCNADLAKIALAAAISIYVSIVSSTNKFLKTPMSNSLMA